MSLFDKSVRWKFASGYALQSYFLHGDSKDNYKINVTTFY